MNEPNEMYETRRVMLAQGRQLDALEGLVRFQHQQIKDLLFWVVDNAKLDVKEKEVIADGMTVTADMLDDLKAQIEGLTRRYEAHSHKTAEMYPYGNTIMSGPEEE